MVNVNAIREAIAEGITKRLYNGGGKMVSLWRPRNAAGNIAKKVISVNPLAINRSLALLVI